MRRKKIYDKLLQWKQEKDGTTALMIEGARRVEMPMRREAIKELVSDHRFNYPETESLIL